MGLDPAFFVDLGALGLVAVLVVRWFGRLEAAMDRLTSAISNQSDGQHSVVRVLTLLAAALRASPPDREALVNDALDELERRKDPRP